MKVSDSINIRLALAVCGLTAIALAPCAQATALSGALTADNAFFAYVSTDNSVLGTLVAQGGDWGTTFVFNNFALTPGQTYYLQIEAINFGGPGAFIGQFGLSDAGFQFANGTQTILTNTTDWQAIFNDGNSDPNSQQPWVTPTGSVTSLGANGVSPWGLRSGIDSNAQWIDAASNGLNVCGFCTVDFSTTITSNGSATPEPSTFGLMGGLAVLLGAVRRRVRR